MSLAVRYTLERSWEGGDGRVCWIMLNPSTAEAHPKGKNDRTVDRCVAFSKRLGFDSLVVVNLYPIRATDPNELRRLADWQGVRPLDLDVRDLLRHNVGIVAAAAKEARLVIAAWGGGVWNPPWVDRVIGQLGLDLYCLGTTKDGKPRHPLYLPAEQPLILWRAAA